MHAVAILSVVTFILVVLGALELVSHRRNLRKLRIRVHVNGTRGKSSVTRLIAAGLREAGIVTCAKTTGTLARMILPNGRELPIFRPAGANIIEQKRVVAAATEFGAEALVLECMALQPELQALSEFKLVAATHGVVTNARPDHLDVMGPTAVDVARALAGTVPRQGKLFTAEREHLAIFKHAAEDRRSELFAISEEDVKAISREELAKFSYTEHAENVALALSVCHSLGVSREIALRGMQACTPDPGALSSYRVAFFGRILVFYNAFAANDPVSTEQLWNIANQQTQEAEAKIAIFNCRADRPDRSLHLGESFAHFQPADHVILMGTGTYLFARAAIKSGLDPSKLHFMEGLNVEEIFERVVSLVERSALIIGMGNIGGQGFELVRFFRNRSMPEAR